MMELRCSLAVVIVPAETLYSLRMMQLDEIGTAMLNEIMSLEAMINNNFSIYNGLSNRELTDVTPHRRPDHHAVSKDDAVDEGVQARQA